jgi:hypothetical protein
MRGGDGSRDCDVCGLPVAGLELHQKAAGDATRYGHHACLAALTSTPRTPRVTVPDACPHCGSNVVQKHCQSRQCTWITCRGCDHYGDVDGRRFVALTRSI